MTTAANADGSGTSDEGAGSGASDDTKDITYYQGELAEAIKRRDSAAKRARDQEKRAKDLEAELETTRNKGAVESGDAKKVDQEWRTKYEKDKAEWETEKTKLSERLRKGVTLAKFGTLAADKVYNLEQVLALVGDKVDVEQDDDGEERLIVHEGKTTRTDVSKWLDEFLDKNPNLARNQGKGGSGAQGTKGGSANGVRTIADLNGMSSQQQREWATKNPDDAKRLLAGIKLGT